MYLLRIPFGGKTYAIALNVSTDRRLLSLCIHRLRRDCSAGPQPVRALPRAYALPLCVGVPPMAFVMFFVVWLVALWRVALVVFADRRLLSLCIHRLRRDLC